MRSRGGARRRFGGLRSPRAPPPSSCGKYAEAAEKYKRAKANLAGDGSSAAKALWTSCALNLSLCLLKLGKPDAAAAEAGAVIKSDKGNVKGYFRRGQARSAAGAHASAVHDLRKAVSLSPSDPLISGSLADAVAAAKEAGVTVADGEGEEEEEDDDGPPPLEAVAPPRGGAGSGGGGSGGGGAAGRTSKEVDALREQMRNDPQAASRMREQFANLSEDQIAAMSAGMPAGMPKLTPEMASTAAAMMKNMSAEQMDSMMALAAKMHGAGGAPGGGPGGMPDMAAMAESMKDPETAKARSRRAAEQRTRSPWLRIAPQNASHALRFLLLPPPDDEQHDEHDVARDAAVHVRGGGHEAVAGAGDRHGGPDEGHVPGVHGQADGGHHILREAGCEGQGGQGVGGAQLRARRRRRRRPAGAAGAVVSRAAGGGCARAGGCGRRPAARGGGIRAQRRRGRGRDGFLGRAGWGRRRAVWSHPVLMKAERT